MTTNFSYILTDDEKFPQYYKQNNLLATRLNSPESLAKLSLKLGKVEGLLLIIAADGANYRVEPGNDKVCYDAYLSSPFYPENSEKMANSMSINLKFFQKYYRGIPRAIVHTNQEEIFVAAIKKLGYVPAKISEEFF